MRWQTGAAVALLAALATVAVVAFAQDGGTPEVEASAPPTVTARPSPSQVTPSPSQSPSPELVLPGNDVEDPLEAIVAIEAYRDWLFENPNPDLVRFIYHPECGCTEPLIEALEGLRAEGVFVVSAAPTAVTDVRLVRADTERDVVVEYTATSAPAEVVSAGGEVVERSTETERRRFMSALTRAADGRWLVVSIQELDG